MGDTVLVAGATSVLGLPTVRELRRRGYDVHGLTRSHEGAAVIADNGAVPVIGDVYDQAGLHGVMRRVRPARPTPRGARCGTGCSTDRPCPRPDCSWS